MSTLNVGTIASDSVNLNTDGSQRIRIDSVGRFFINGTASLTTSQTSWRWDINGVQYGNLSSAGTMQAFRVNGSSVGSIFAGTSSTSFNTSSDYRLKENVTAISDGIARLKTLKPYRFNFIAEPEKIVDGFFAHEMTAVPEAITGTKDEVDSDNNPVYQGIDQSKLVPLLTAALQEAIGKIEVLETKVAALEAK